MSGGSTTGGRGGSGASSGSTTGGASGSAAGDAGEGGTTSGGTTSGGTTSGGTTSEGGTTSGGTTNGGTAGSGDAGEGGTSGGGSQPECLSPDDCRMVSDCCGCRSEPLDDPTFCALPCVRDACGEEMISVDEVDCVQGRCVIARSCDGQVDCPALPPNCPDGTVPSVLGDCWGPCLPPTDCRSVSGCAACGDDFCVEFQAMRSIFSCVTRVDECEVENYCQCLGVCGECSETDDQVQCPCLGC